MTIYLGDTDNTYNAPLGEPDSVDAQGGTDRLVLNYSTSSGPISCNYYSNGAWTYYSDGAFNTLWFVNFESYDITGGAESDSLFGGSLADRLLGGAGNDTIAGGLGADIINGGAGTDLWKVDYSSIGEDVSVILSTSATPVTIDVTGAKISGIEALTITTGIGNDTINTSAFSGNDSITTGSGDDTIRSGLGFDSINAGDGIDTLIMNYSTLTEDIQHFDAGYGWYQFQDGEIPTASTYYYRASVEQFNLTGGIGDDNLSGRSDYDGNDRLVGGSGNDTLYGYGGTDTINGGAGTDTWRAIYDEVNDYITIDISTTTQVASTGATISGIEQLIVDTYDGNDTIICNAGIYNDTINTNRGDDVVTMGRGVDTLNAGEGSDTVILNWSSATANITNADDGYGWWKYSSGSGDSLRYYGVENFVVTGGSGNDYLSAWGGNDTLKGGAGNDTLNSSSGKAIIDGGDGSDIWQADVSGIVSGLVVNAATSQTTAQGTAAGHSIRNIEGFSLTTGNGNDRLTSEGYALNDSVVTNGGTDTVSLGLGFDSANGGNEIDTLIVDYSTRTSAVTRVDAGYGWYRYADTANTASITYINFEKFNLTGGSKGDRLYGADSDDTLIGNGGNDVLTGGAGKDIINGGGGTDTWSGNYSALTAKVTLTLLATGTSWLKSGTTNWTSLTGIENVNLQTGSNQDAIDLRAVTGNHVINTHDGNDSIMISAGKHEVNGENGNDVLVIDFSTSTSSIIHKDDGYGWWKIYDTAGVNSARYINFEQYDITSGSGDDRISANNNDDKLNGGAGADTLNGVGGNDLLTGGSGADIFYYESYNNGLDTITDLAAGDVVRVNGRNFNAQSVILGDGTSVTTNQVQLSVDAVANESFLYIGSDGTAGADVIIKLQGTYSTDSFSFSGRNILVTAGSSNPGTPGDDLIIGTSGNDTLEGGVGSDTLKGLGGNDILSGGSGNDTLLGGMGVDNLTGGTGADTFVYTSMWESTPGTAYHDEIMDFSISEGDKINLSAIDANPVQAGNNAFKFITTDFTGSAGQLRYDGASGMIFGDVNGDGMADLEIALRGTAPATLVATNFVL